MEERLLKPEAIPESLWDSSRGVLMLPSALASVYTRVIDRHGLRGMATTRDFDDPPVGGLDQKLSDKHFAQAFDGSCARVQLAVLDPKGDVNGASNSFLCCLSGNSVGITDAPCGAGAAVLSLLATIAELRAQKIVPRVPLYVDLIGAEISAPARSYAQELFSELMVDLESQAIFVTMEWVDWDVTCILSTTDLISKMTLASADKAHRLLVVANFNAFLEKDRKKQAAEPQLSELFRHASGDNSLAIWIEPNMNRATDSLFPWLGKLIKKAWRRFARLHFSEDGAKPAAISDARFQLPLTPGETARVGLAVLAIDLGRNR